VELCRHLWVKLHLDLLLAALFDCLVERDNMFRQLDAAKLLQETVMNVLRSDRAEGLARLPGLQGKIEDKLVDPAGQLLGSAQLARFAFAPLGSQMIDPAERTRRDLERFAARNEEVARKATTDFDEIGFGAEPRDIFRENNFSVCHGSPAEGNFEASSLAQRVNPKSWKIVEGMDQSDGSGFWQCAGFHLVHDISETEAVLGIGKGKASSRAGMTEC
jgi:hypothetical protein